MNVQEQYTTMLNRRVHAEQAEIAAKGHREIEYKIQEELEDHLKEHGPELVIAEGKRWMLWSDNGNLSRKLVPEKS